MTPRRSRAGPAGLPVRAATHAEGLLPESSSFWQRRRVQSFLELRDELRQLFARRGIPERTSHDLILATQEACNNACRHSRDGCDIVVTWLDDTIVVEVADRGRGFDLDAVKATWPPGLLQDSGRGLYLIAELTDQMEVVRRDRGTLVRIFKVVS